VDIWYGLGFTETDELIVLSQLAEELGYTGVALPDHLVTPARIDSRYPYSVGSAIWWSSTAHLPDPWVMSGVIASHTSTLKIMTAVYVLPLHELFGTAKAIGTAAYLAKGRLVLGIGVGWMSEEFDLTGQSFAGRGRRTEEMVTVLRLLLSGEPVSFQGEYYKFEELTMVPAPSEPLPIVVGGNSDIALRRAARYDGWLGGGPHDPAEIRPLLNRLAELRVGPAGPLPYETMTTLSGPIDRATLAELEAAGVTGVVTQWFRAEHAALSLADKCAAMRRTASELLG
jgi:probable F420-dependent oxidoreductase